MDFTLVAVNFANRGNSSRGGRGGRHTSLAHQPSHGSPTNQKTSQDMGRGRGYTNSSSNNRPICQVYNKPGYAALSCYQRFDNSYFAKTNSNMQALLTTPQGPSNLNWYLDSRATHHLTNDLANLNM